METLFKKYFWVINLLGLSIVAWLLAQTVVDYLAATYLDIQPTATTETVANQSGELLRKAPGDELGQILTRRNPFNVDKPAEEVETAEECSPECTDKECGDDGCEGSCGDCGEGKRCTESGTCEDATDDPEESELPIQLVGTFVNPTDPNLRFANVLLNGSTSQMVGVNQSLLNDQATVVDILPKMLYLREGNKLTYRSLWSKAPPPGKASPASRIRTQASRPLVRPNPSQSVRPSQNRGGVNRGLAVNWTEHVEKQSDFEYQISKQMLDEQLTDLTQLGMQARVIPNYRKGKYEGFKLVGVRPGSLYRAIGIRSGDIVRSINGAPINSPNKAMELFNQLKNSAAIQMEVERRGQIETFNYTIQ
jgi:general secretion pathway protein C